MVRKGATALTKPAEGARLKYIWYGGLYVGGDLERRTVQAAVKISVRMLVTRDAVVAIRKAKARFASALPALGVAASGSRSGVVSVAG